MNRKLRLLLIDDDPAWRATLADYLRSRGFHVQSVPDGAAGLALLDRGDVALVLVDSHMPDMDGLDFLRQVRRRRSTVPVLMVSGEDDSFLSRRVLAEGGQGFISKTASPNLLLRTVRQILGLPGASSEGNGYIRLGRRYLPVPRRISRYLPVPVPNTQPAGAAER